MHELPQMWTKQVSREPISYFYDSTF